jgi:glycosyltransferase involved in cell wall biosynthesis
MKKKLKILRVTTSPESLAILLKGQLKFLNFFFEVVGISSPGYHLNQVRLNEKIRVIPLKMVRRPSPLKDIISLVKMILIIKKEKPDIIHSHSPKAGFVSMIASKICNVPHRLHTVAGLPLMEETGLKKKILIIIERLTYKCATKIHPNSKILKKFILKKIYNNKKKISVLNHGSSNGIDINYFKKTKSLTNHANSFKKKHKLEKTFTFIFVGRIVKDKGVEELLSAFIKLNKKISNIRLLLVGREERMIDPISDDARNVLKKNKNIINVGYKKDIRKFLAASNCLVLPSYREGFPNVLLQADCMNLPSITSNINGCNEIIKNRQNGLLIRPKHKKSLFLAMKKIVNDKKFYEDLKNFTRHSTVKKFNQKEYFNTILQYYLDLSKKIFFS